MKKSDELINLKYSVLHSRLQLLGYVFQMQHRITTRNIVIENRSENKLFYTISII